MLTAYVLAVFCGCSLGFFCGQILRRMKSNTARGTTRKTSRRRKHRTVRCQSSRPYFQVSEDLRVYLSKPVERHVQ